MIKLLICNFVDYHYEIIESLIINYKQLFNNQLNNIKHIEIYLNIIENDSFSNYIKNKYPKVIFKEINDFDYYINCTIYDYNYNDLDKTEFSNKKYICHKITERLKQNPNVFFLTPLANKSLFNAIYLPFSQNKIYNKIPIYIIQGNISKTRRYYPLLIEILENTKEYKDFFKIKLIGNGNLPKKLNKYKDQIIFKNNLNFVDYHKEFLDAYCILPLITKKTHKDYYINKLTSSINYSIAYNLKTIIDKDLQEIYKLKNVELFDNIKNITNAFKKTLISFYE